MGQLLFFLKNSHTIIAISVFVQTKSFRTMEALPAEMRETRDARNLSDFE